MQPVPVLPDYSLQYRRAGRQGSDGAAGLVNRDDVVRPGVGGECGEAFDGFNVGGVVVAHNCAVTGEEAWGQVSLILSVQGVGVG